MKTWQVRFKKRGEKPILIEAASHRVASDRATLQFYDDAGKAIRSFGVINVKDVTLFADPEDTFIN